MRTTTFDCVHATQSVACALLNHARHARQSIVDRWYSFHVVSIEIFEHHGRQPLGQLKKMPKEHPWTSNVWSSIPQDEVFHSKKLLTQN